MTFASPSKNDQAPDASASSIAKNGPARAMHFYQDKRLATEVTLQGHRHIVWAADMALAQLEQSKRAKVLKVDQTNSVLGVPAELAAYTPYGHLPADKALALIGFNGEWRDPLAQGDMLGAGRRLYAQAIKRFCSSDLQSPFGEGGLNSYAYCAGDPINYIDPTGEMRLPLWLSNTLSKLGNHITNFAIYGVHSPKANGPNPRMNITSDLSSARGQLGSNSNINLASPALDKFARRPSGAAAPTAADNIHTRVQNPVAKGMTDLSEQRLHTTPYSLQKDLKPKSNVHINRSTGRGWKGSGNLAAVMQTFFGALVVGVAVFVIVKKIRE
ncbi:MULTISPECIES: RHS repeat-associated core domain-containing protein [Pseudomonas]|uniref:RHS repeat-associated core domain-containing protein n=1 Tax=Pseudomonas juntendi TaxID=2666183 RepID=A0A7W2QAC3_9PSED|nr:MULTISPECIES: RHS repeat-associated core domain-containing protein [Pseudomonas]MBA6098725.1 RHS repeat-associated core domain-containing protein [Pseudomonas juntendi]